jgi:hypothetical protein
MSKIGTSFFKRNTYQVDIITKSSQKEQKEQKKNQKLEKKNADKPNNNKYCVSDNDFNELMRENETQKNQKNHTNLSDYLSKVSNSQIANELIQKQIFGNDLVKKIQMENISGSELLKAILNKYIDLENYTWIESNQYGASLEFLLKDNLDEQLLCLFVVQNHAYSHGFGKINYKNVQVYWLKVIFQLLFTNDIIDESTYWRWQDILVEIADLDENTKKTICIQTAEFFHILKITFTEEDYENEDTNKDENLKINPNLNKKEENKKKKSYGDLENKSDSESDKYIVPEEQDYNMDDL